MKTSVFNRLPSSSMHCGHHEGAHKVLMYERNESVDLNFTFSGLAPSISGGIPTLRNEYPPLRTPENMPIVILGSGISPSTIVLIVTVMWPLGCHEYHLSGGRFVQGQSDVSSREAKMDMGMGGWDVWSTNRSIVAETKRLAVQAILEIEKA
jgi:hypothetical protein